MRCLIAWAVNGTEGLEATMSQSIAMELPNLIWQDSIILMNGSKILMLLQVILFRILLPKMKAGPSKLIYCLQVISPPNQNLN